MKIGIVCYPAYGGSGIIATELGAELAKRGNEVHFITYSQPIRMDALNERIFYHEITVKTYSVMKYEPYELALTGRIVEVVQNQQLDLLHVHYAVPHAISTYFAQQILKEKGYDIPFITTLHGTDITIVGKDEIYEPQISFAINHSNEVTSVSQSLKNDTLKIFNINREIKVVPNFVNLERFYKRKKNHFKRAICPNGEKLITHVSNFRKVKRVDDIVKSFCKISRSVPSKLLLVGDGPERSRIESLARDLCQCSDIRFLGKLGEVEEILSISDLFMMASEKESFGLASLEAMACEVPVICTDAGGQAELNIDEKTGFLCKIGDIESMAEKALYVLRKENYPLFQKNALARAKEFDINKIIKKYIKVYEGCLQSVNKYSP